MNPELGQHNLPREVCLKCRLIFTSHNTIKSLFSDDGLLRPRTEVNHGCTTNCTFCRFLRYGIPYIAEALDGRTESKADIDSHRIKICAIAEDGKGRVDYWTSNTIEKLRFTCQLSWQPEKLPGVPPRRQELAWSAYALEGN